MPEKGARDRLIPMAANHADWALGFEDETLRQAQGRLWFSRLAHPSLHAWADTGQPLRLVEQSLPKDDPDPKALASYGRFQPNGSFCYWLRNSRFG
jgi:hypothetical protein